MATGSSDAEAVLTGTTLRASRELTRHTPCGLSLNCLTEEGAGLTSLRPHVYGIQLTKRGKPLWVLPKITGPLTGVEAAALDSSEVEPSGAGALRVHTGGEVALDRRETGTQKQPRPLGRRLRLRLWGRDR